ncbi:MAG: D-2-hydroxyacid dehydrogenase [Elainellaceae cyanobacterium]
MKLILPIDVADVLPDRLPKDVAIVWADAEGNLSGDASNADVYFNGFYLNKDAYHRVLTAAPAIRWQHSPSAGVDHLLTPLFLEREITLTNSAGVYAIPIAEYVLAMILNQAKQLALLREWQTQRYWHQIELQELSGATLLIIGAGSIGQEIAKRANAFGMRVWGSRRSAQFLPNFERMVGADEWRSLLPDADYIVIAAPLTPETKGMIDESALRSLRPTAYLINIARGAIVDEPALLNALKEKRLAGAALDTFYTEPLSSQSPFWSLPNTVITSHTSGLSPHNIDRIIDLFLENLGCYQQGQPLKNVVDKQARY